MGNYHSRESSRTRARKRREHLIRVFSLVTCIVLLGTVGAVEWRRYVRDQEKRLSESWRSVAEQTHSDFEDNNIIVPLNEESTAPTVAAPVAATPVAAAPAPSAPVATPTPANVPRKRSGVASLFFGERELISLDTQGRPVQKQENLFRR
jgi:cytoskeletal protein RodZ